MTRRSLGLLKAWRFCLGPILVLFVAAGCMGLANGTLTGNIEEVVIEDGLSAPEVRLRPGDELRLVNRHGAPVHVVFLDQIDGRVTCTRGFGLARVANGKRLDPEESFSVCFGSPGTIRYTVKLDRATSTGSFNVPGTIRVEVPEGRRT